MAIIILNDKFERLCEVVDYHSVLWHPLYLDETGGDFQLELSSQKYIDYIDKGYYVINTESDKFGIVDTFETKESEDAGKILTASGYMGESMLMRRILFPSVSLSGPLHEVVGALLRQNIISPSNDNRRIPGFTYAEDSAFDEVVSKQYTGKALSAALVGLCAYCGCSYAVTFNAAYNGFVLRLFSGADRTINQLVNPRIVFSTEDYGVSEFTYKTSARGTATHIVCAGEGEGSQRKYVIYPSTSTTETIGINRREAYLDVKNISSDAGKDENISDDIYYHKLRTEAAEKLAESSTSEACEGVIKQSRYKVGEDFFLGDLVTVMDDDLVRGYNTRVLGVLISWDENGAREVTAEMGNLNISDVSDTPEEDPKEEKEKEQTEDSTKTSLREDIRPFTFTGSNLVTFGSTVGKPSGWLHIFDNTKMEIVFTANTRYFRKGSGEDDPSLGEFSFTLSTAQHSRIGGAIAKELEGSIWPVVTMSRYYENKYTGYFTVETVTATEETDENGKTAYVYKCTTKLEITASTGGDYIMLMNGIRNIVIPDFGAATEVSYLENPDTIQDSRKGAYWLIVRRSIAGATAIFDKESEVTAYDYWCYFFDAVPQVYWEYESFAGERSYLFASTALKGFYQTPSDYPSAKSKIFDYSRSSGASIPTMNPGDDEPPAQLAIWAMRARNDPDTVCHINPWLICAANFDVYDNEGNLVQKANAETVGSHRQ